MSSGQQSVNSFPPCVLLFLFHLAPAVNSPHPETSTLSTMSTASVQPIGVPPVSSGDFYAAKAHLRVTCVATRPLTHTLCSHSAISLPVSTNQVVSLLLMNNSNTNSSSSSSSNLYSPPHQLLQMEEPLLHQSQSSTRNCKSDKRRRGSHWRSTFTRTKRRCVLQLVRFPFFGSTD